VPTFAETALTFSGAAAGTRPRFPTEDQINASTNGARFTANMKSKGSSRLEPVIVTLLAAVCWTKLTPRNIS
jgi:hypothetical protein